MRAKKRFGQNFLVDDGYIASIVDHLNIDPSDNVIEIGPGHGAMTGQINAKNLTVIEVDNDLIADLSDKFPKINIINNDALVVNWGEIYLNSRFRLVGNLPYNISSEIIFKSIEYIDSIIDINIMIQQEFAKRLYAEPNTSSYGIISILIQDRFYVEKILTVPAEAFKPKPKVTSEFVQLIPKKNYEYSLDYYKFFVKIIKTAFNMRRKMLRQSLKGVPNLDVVSDIISLSSRPQEIGIYTWHKICAKLFIESKNKE